MEKPDVANILSLICRELNSTILCNRTGIIFDENKYTLGIDIGSTTVKIAILDENKLLFSQITSAILPTFRKHLQSFSTKARETGRMTLHPVITGSGGLTLANHLGVPFVQEVIAVSTSLQKSSRRRQMLPSSLAVRMPRSSTFEGGNVEQRMNGICAGGTGSFIDQMASLLQTDASG